MSKKILFVHGTGVREPALSNTKSLIASKIKTFLGQHEVHFCEWGVGLGATLHHGGKSIPGYVAAGGNPAPAVEDANRARWEILSRDPLFELRTLSSSVCLGDKPGLAIWQQVLTLGESVPALNHVASLQMTDCWKAVVLGIVQDPYWKEVVEGIPVQSYEVSSELARAVCARFIADLRSNGYPTPTGVQRDQLVDALLTHFGGQAAGIKDWALEHLAAYVGVRRGSLTDATSPAIGDILRYQARGKELRNYIGMRAKEVGASVILAHSLGGIAAVDWLISGDRQIEALITVGSQAPYLYEIDALHSLRYNKQLPKHFPKKWLNIYDPKDFLSYSAYEVFAKRAMDLPVDNGQPFPESHSAYWNNDAEVWPEIARIVNQLHHAG
ncbi:hypothetical protein GTP91_13310 [Rugamonas sp. FT82W]|uniref:Alpha/beta hydrolase n=1 Tax=Duganella vulcania TaxID=2692166 RepID=A0A845G1F9_9BURK|nr:hypothetical protein [Duganella vulcania]MYM88154.1 hypothetical protein [Duganella vulcania]